MTYRKPPFVFVANVAGLGSLGSLGSFGSLGIWTWQVLTNIASGNADQTRVVVEQVLKLSSCHSGHAGHIGHVCWLSVGRLDHVGSRTVFRSF